MSGTSLTENKGHKSAAALTAYETEDFVTMFIGGQLFGIPVATVQDVLAPQSITRVPLAPPEIAGSLNLRGRIVTAIDIRRRLGMPPRGPGEGHGMNVVVEFGGDLYSLVFDTVGEVMPLPRANFEANPATLEPGWRDISKGICRLENNLLIVIDVARLLNFTHIEAA